MDDDSVKPITNQGFFTYVFKLSKFKQEDLMNIVQYSLLSIIPVILFVYFTKKYFPTVSENDASLYVFIVTFIEIIFMIVGIFFIDRIINYIPTYSGKYYETINLTTIIIVFILFMLITHGGFRDRTRILLRRFDDWFTIDDIIAKKLGMIPKPFNMFSDDIELIDINAKNGKGKKKPGNGGGGGGAASAAASGGGGGGGQQMSQQYATPAPLPIQGPVMQNPMPNYGGNIPAQQAPMYSNPANSMAGGATQGMEDMYMEPMAANAVLGGGCSWSSW